MVILIGASIVYFCSPSVLVLILRPAISRKVWRIVRASKCSTEYRIWRWTFTYLVKWFTYGIRVIRVISIAFTATF
jgi:hypothetical protein